jgi:hypothetical protein
MGEQQLEGQNSRKKQREPTTTKCAVAASLTFWIFFSLINFIDITITSRVPLPPLSSPLDLLFISSIDVSNSFLFKQITIAKISSGPLPHPILYNRGGWSRFYRRTRRGRLQESDER